MNRRKKLDLYFLLFSLFILLLLVFPIYDLGNKLEPFILGVPFSLAWIVICILLQFVGILFFLLIDKE